MNPGWSANRETLATNLLRVTISQNRAEFGASTATYAEVIDKWQHDEAFRSWFNQQLAEVPFESFRWETPAVNLKNVNRPFEFVVLDSPQLVSRPDQAAFAEHFYRGDCETVVKFANLGRNAQLIVPCPLVADQHYPHLGAFVRGAPASQQDRLWQCVGQAMTARLSDRPVWLSTAGAGVSWLHVRLDDSPKYYHHVPYRTA